MGLHAYAVDTDVSGSEVGDQGGGVDGLRAGPFNAVVVVEELDGERVVGDDFGGVGEGELHVIGTDSVVPDVVSPWVGGGWTVGECFVDNIPVGAVVTPVDNELLDVVQHDRQEGVAGPNAIVDPVGQFRVPDLQGISGKKRRVENKNREGEGKEEKERIGKEKGENAPSCDSGSG